MRKNLLSQNFKCLVFFKSTRQVYYQPSFNLILNFNQNHFSSKKHIFAFLTKNRGLIDSFSEKPLNFYPLNSQGHNFYKLKYISLEEVKIVPFQQQFLSDATKCNLFKLYLKLFRPRSNCKPSTI